MFYIDDIVYPNTNDVINTIIIKYIYSTIVYGTISPNPTVNDVIVPKYNDTI